MKKKVIEIKNIFNVLIADKNSNVLNFLKREFVEEGYRVVTANDILTFISILNHDDKPDLIIIDPVLPGVNVCLRLQELKKQNPDLPVIVHTYLSDFYEIPAIMEDVFFIEKEGGSIENMKKIISDLINKRKGP